MSIERKLIGTVDASSGPAVYVEDVFSTWLYTGNGGTQTINNGINLADNGGMVWSKWRSGVFTSARHSIFDTARGANKEISTVNVFGSSTWSNTLMSFTTSGFTAGSDANIGTINRSGASYVAWTFRKAPKFFDVVTYTGTGSARTISHALGSTPGMIIVKRTDTTGNWQVYHRSLTSASNSIQLNLTDAEASATTVWNSTAPTSSVFSVGTDATVNASGGTYVAYLFAHDAGGFGAAGTDSVAACGSYTGNGSESGPTVTLGWEPQFVIVKNASATGDWNMFDNMRGIPTGSADPYLFANSSAAEATTTGDLIDLTSTGFVIKSTNSQVNTSGNTYIYLAIRRGPMKTPTDATKVFAPVTYTGNGSTTGNSISSGFVTDLGIITSRAGNIPSWYDRLRGTPVLTSFSSNDETIYSSCISSFLQDGISVRLASTGSATGATNANGTMYVSHMFRRAPGFFDVVCYTGTGSARTLAHNLGVAPELIILKRRDAAFEWIISAFVSGFTDNVTSGLLPGNSALTAGSSNSYLTSGSMTFGIVNGAGFVNALGGTYVAYLFASCPGVSKVGSYTGNGSSQTIDCGFASGARFVLIKRTDSTGDWWVYDSARGIVAANDPALRLNSTSAEVASADAVDPQNSGFIVNQEATCNINVSGASYIFLSVA